MTSSSGFQTVYDFNDLYMIYMTLSLEINSSPLIRTFFRQVPQESRQTIQVSIRRATVYYKPQMVGGISPQEWRALFFFFFFFAFLCGADYSA